MELPVSCSTPSKGRGSATNAGLRRMCKSLKDNNLADAEDWAGMAMSSVRDTFVP